MKLHSQVIIQWKHLALAIFFSGWTSACQVKPSFVSELSTTPLPPIVKSFAASPNPVERDTSLILSWDVPGATSVTIWPMTMDCKMYQWYRTPRGEHYLGLISPTATGSATGQVAIPISPDQYRSFKFELEATGASGEKVTATTEDINLQCALPMVDPQSATGLSGSCGYDCPYPPKSISAAFQPFEHGYLIWRGDTQEIYILPEPDHPVYSPSWSIHAAMALTASIGTPQDGLYAPAERFVGLWSLFSQKVYVRSLAAYEDVTVSEILGWATAPEQTYTVKLQPLRSEYTYINALSLPNGHVILLVMNGLSFEPTTGGSWQEEGGR